MLAPFGALQLNSFCEPDHHCHASKESDRAMTKEQILAAIRSAAVANGGRPLGRERFLVATGIGESDWHGKYWIRWSDAVREAGFAPNSYNKARDGDDMLERLSAFVRELQHFPVTGELKLKCRLDPSFPNPKTFSRFGSKSKLIAAVGEFARKRGYQDVVSICESGMPPRIGYPDALSGPRKGDQPTGYVYLLKHGTRREFKVGRTNNPLRREGEIGVELPQRIQPIHVIETDDPAGVESYWHRRFKEKQLKNEWFALAPADVQAFRRWRKIF
jgi:hypothetical protein